MQYAAAHQDVTAAVQYAAAHQDVTAAVQYAAAHQDVTLGLVTLGSPLAAAPVAPFENPALADAVRAVRTLAPALARPTLDAALAYLHDAVDNFVKVPASSFANVPALPDLGAVPALALTAGSSFPLATAVRDVLVAGLNQVTRRAPTHVAAAVELPLPLEGRPAPVRVDFDARVDLGKLALATGAPAAPKRVRVRARITRSGGGALLEGHLSRTDSDVDARMRWAELELGVAAGATTFAVLLHDATLHGARRAVCDLGDPLGLQLLALLVDELDQLAELTPRLRALLNVLKDLDVLVFDRDHGLSLAADAFAQLKSDAAAWLAPRVAVLLDGPTGFAGLLRAAEAADRRGPWTRSLAPLPLELRVTPEPWTATLATTGDGFALLPERRRPDGVAGAAAGRRSAGRRRAAPRPAARRPRGRDRDDHGRRRRPRRAARDRAAGRRPAAAAARRRPAAAHLRRAVGAARRAARPRRRTSGAQPARLLHDPGAFLHERLFAPDTAAQLNSALAALGSLVGLTVTADGAIALPAGLTLRAGAGAGGLTCSSPCPPGASRSSTARRSTCASACASTRPAARRPPATWVWSSTFRTPGPRAGTR